MKKVIHSLIYRSYYKLRSLLFTDNRLHFLSILILLLVLSIGAVIVYFEWKNAVTEHGDAVIASAQKLSYSLDVERLKALKGNSSDLTHPIYVRTKAHLQAHQLANPSIHSIQLIGRKIDGTLFYYLDSETAESPQIHGSGQHYAKHNAEVQKVFELNQPLVSSKVKSRLGDIQTVCVPIASNFKKMQVQAQQDKARAMVHAAIAYYREYGRERFLDELNDPQGCFRKGELYAFAYDQTMTIVGHPVKPSLIGVNLLDKKDWDGGKYFRREIRDLARDKRTGWVHYEYENPSNGVREPKTTFVEAVDNLIICAGAYRSPYSVFAVLTIELDAEVENDAVLKAIFPSILLTMALVFIFISGRRYFLMRSKMTFIPLSLRRLEASLILATGLSVTAYAAWKVHLYEQEELQRRFSENAQTKFSAITTVLKNIRDFSDGLVNSCAKTEVLTQKNFSAYAEYLTKMKEVQSWAWVSIVPDEKQSVFIEDQKKHHANFEIFDRYPYENRVRAQGRTIYYPLTFIAPISENEEIIGCDLGSELNRSAMVDECVRTGYPTTSQALTFLKDEGTDAKGVMVLRPVYDRFNLSDSRKLKGFVLCNLRFHDLINTEKADDRIELAIFQINSLYKDVPLAHTWDDNRTVNSSFKTEDTLLIFGKTFRLIAYGGEGYTANTFGGWILVVFIGTLVTALVATMLTTVLRRREQLEALVQERTHDLSEAMTKAEAASKAKSEFLANMSHEIRTPLNGVIGFTDLLKNTSLSPLQQQYVDNANVSGHTLLDIINDILDFSKIEAGMMHLEIIKTDMIMLFENSVDIVRYSAGKKNLEILLDIDQGMPRFAMVDPVRLKQVLANLLSNAVKFTEKGEVELKVIYTPEGSEKGTFSISVRDTGIGISETQREKLFKAFSQADSSTTRKFGGTGLGLIISSMIMHKMGAEIHIASVPGTGSTFFFKLTTDTEQGPPRKLNDISNIKNCLIIDDNGNNRLILEHILKSWEIANTSCENGFFALKMLENSMAFDVIICDYNMPEMDGLETISRIRETLKLTPEKQPIILLHSSSDDAELHKQCDALGVRFCMTKPIKQEQLFDCLATICEPSRSNSSNQSDAVKAIQSREIATQKSPEGLKILVADDVPMNVKLTEALLINLLDNPMIITAENGKVALQKYQEFTPDLIFMDVQMPEMDGLSATKAIREIEMDSDKHTTIIAFTAGALKEEQERCIAAGMDAFLTKPINQNKLSEVVTPFLLAIGSKRQVNNAETKSETILDKDHFNMDDFLNSYGNEFSMIYSLIKTVLYEYPKMIETLETEIRHNHREGLLNITHKLKGSLLNEYASRLASVSKKLEQGAKNNKDNHWILEQFEELKSEWKIVKNILEKYSNN